jgi:hypothetical protein
MGFWGAHPMFHRKKAPCLGTHGADSSSPSPHHRHQRKKRFRVRPEARGIGYGEFDLPAPGVRMSQIPTYGVQRAVLPSPANSNQIARHGLWMCIGVLIGVIALMEFPLVQKFFVSVIYCAHILSRFWQL